MKENRNWLAKILIFQRAKNKLSLSAHTQSVFEGDTA